MKITNEKIDHGKAFDFGQTSADYALYRDIYPQIFYDKILSRNLCVQGQNALDIGTGTGVIPRNMYRYGAKWTGADISENQIEQAKLLSEEMDIDYVIAPAENLDFPENAFDVITACQCFSYFNHEMLAPKLAKMLKPDGRLLLLYMGWLPFEDEIAKASENLVLKYSPNWSGCGGTKQPIEIPACYRTYFELVYHEEYLLRVPFTRESWNGRMKSCRGIGASLSPDEIARWEQEHRMLLEKIAPEQFDILHYAAMAELKKK